MSSKAAPPPAPLNLEAALTEAVKDLDNTDIQQVAAACIAIVLLSPRLETNCACLEQATPKLIQLLSSNNQAVQKNACAALTALVTNSLPYWQLAVAHNVAQQAVSVASNAKHPDLKLNFANLLGAVAEGGEAGAKAVLKAGGADPVFELLGVKLDEALQEAGVDAVCKLATNEAVRPELSKLGAIEKLAAMLQSSSKEVAVRTLLALGMLLGDNKENQKRLASFPGAVQSLTELMRQQDDEDCRQITRGIFATLSKNDDVKAEMAAALQADTASAEAAYL
ncbi:hypothetical protein WJX72_003430 [[Myrmecia] bisecta]|uniref:Vacuolar protein 8 n=1 Tax=[Myrmecia] bisecta TaxID=41462 RepID=A0AAW1PTX1_9CHLO